MHASLLPHSAWHTVAALLLAAALGAADASAQTGFVQAGYGPDERRFSAEEGQEVFDGRAASLSLAGGAFVAPRWSVSLELDFGGGTTASRSVSVPVAGRPTTITTSFTLDRRSVLALAGFHTTSARRLRIGCYAGLGFSSVRREIASDVSSMVVTDPPEPSVFTDRTADPVVGVDVAVRIAPHLSLVGGVRAQGLVLTGDSRGFSVRPFAAARVAF